MLYAQARRDARRDAQGEYVPLAEQDPAAWDAALIDEAEALLARASALPGTGRYQLEAAVQSAHVVRRQTGRSDWAAIERIYDALFAMTGSPVVAINRAIAVAEIARRRRRPRRRSPRSRTTRGSPTISPTGRRAPGCWRARANAEAADAAYERAIGLERDPAVRRFLERRRAALRERAPAPTGSA